MATAADPDGRERLTPGSLPRLQFSDGEEEKIKKAVGTFCSNQPFALEIIKTKQKKDSRFTSFVQVAPGVRLKCVAVVTVPDEC